VGLKQTPGKLAGLPPSSSASPILELVDALTAQGNPRFSRTSELRAASCVHR